MIKHIFLLVGFFSVIAAEDADCLKDSVVVKRKIPPQINLCVEPIHDNWFSQDKFFHFSACAATCGLTYHFYTNRLNRDEEKGKVYAISLTAFIGIGKEIYDKKKKGYFSWKDLVWDAVGLTAGYFIFVHEY